MNENKEPRLHFPLNVKTLVGSERGIKIAFRDDQRGDIFVFLSPLLICLR
jgi:hypothetical protein